MAKFKDLTGKSYGRLTVVKQAPDYIQPNGRRRVRWECVCSCPNKTICAVRGEDLRSGNSQSCGCLQKETVRKTMTVHGKHGTHLSRIWRGMKSRCCNPNVANFKYYGGRGITVFPGWNDFQTFYDDVSKLPHFGEKGYSLDRINNDGNYEPGNVRWATAKEQSDNKRKPGGGYEKDRLCSRW